MYSKGIRQKVGLAIASAKHAKAMLLDEPTSGLDPSPANDFAQRIRTAADNGMAVLMATHDLFNAKQVADRIGIMKSGRLVEEFDAVRKSQFDFMERWSAVSAALAVILMADKLAGIDAPRYAEFIQQVNQFED